MKTIIWETISWVVYPVLDWASVFVSCLLAYTIYHHLEIGRQVTYGRIEYVTISILAATVALITLYMSGAYKRDSSVLNVSEIKSVVKGVTYAFLLYLLLTFILRVNHSRYIVIMAFIFSLISVVFVRTLIYHLHPYWSHKYAFAKRVLILGAGELGQGLYRAIMDSPRLNVLPVGFLDDDPTKIDLSINRSGFNTQQSIKVLGNFTEMEQLVREHKVDAIFVAVSDINNEILDTIVQRAKALNMNVRFIPRLYKSFLHKLHVVQVGPFPMIEEIDPLPGYYRHVKRVSDIILTLFFLILFSPVWALISILIKIDSKGPVLFKHERVGKDGKLFRMYKFRSMYMETPTYAVNPTSADDSRVTRMGRFIRRTSLDEIPQIINVLKGEMSLVGPRPEMPFIVEQYTDYHRERLVVLPGITGLWQLSGDRKQAIHENMDYDLYYIRNQSFAMDLAILIETLIFAFRGV